MVNDFPSQIRRLDFEWTSVFPPHFFSLEDLGSPSLSFFFTLTNNNIPTIPSPTTIIIIFYIFSSLCRLKATALQSRRGGWPSQ